MRMMRTALIAAASVLALVLTGCTGSEEPVDPETSQKAVDVPQPESPQSLPMSLLTAQGITESSVELIFTRAETDYYRAETSNSLMCLVVALRIDEVLGSRCADEGDFSAEGVKVTVSSDRQDIEAILIPAEASFELAERFELVTDTLAIAD